MRTTFGSPLFADLVPAAGRGARRAGRGRRRGAGRQDQRAGVRRRLADHQPACSAPPATPTTRRSPAAAAAAERRSRSRPAWWRSPTAATWAARCATRRASAACSACARRPGRVPHLPAADAFFDLSVVGPMGRCAADAALLLSATAGPHPRRPAVALPEPGSTFAGPLDARPARACASPGAGRWGCRSSAAVLDAFAARPARASSSSGVVLADAEPDVRGADEVFRVLRGWHMATTIGDAVERGRRRRRRAGAGQRRLRPDRHGGAARPRCRPAAPRCWWPPRSSSRGTTTCSCRSARCCRSTSGTLWVRGGRAASRSPTTWAGCARRTSSACCGCPAASVPAGTTPDGPAGRAAGGGPARRRPRGAAAVRRAGAGAAGLAPAGPGRAGPGRRGARLTRAGVSGTAC